METKKLTCCDLMVGDWVEVNGKFIQVENVHKDMINYTPDIPYVQEEYFIEEKDITPIPLTPRSGLFTTPKQVSKPTSCENPFTTATKVFCSAQCHGDYNHDLQETRYMNLKQKGRIHNNE